MLSHVLKVYCDCGCFQILNFFCSHLRKLVELLKFSFRSLFLSFESRFVNIAGFRLILILAVGLVKQLELIRNDILQAELLFILALVSL